MKKHTLLSQYAPRAGLTIALLTASSAYAQMSCDTVTTDTLGITGVRVLASEEVAADAGSPIAHCRLEALTEERTGLDGHDYAIHFEIRLPDNWNGRFVHQFNGATDGSVVPAFGSLLGGNSQRTALGEGYAVLSSDAGHDGDSYPDAQLAAGSRFGLDPEARLNYGYKAVETLTPIGKQILTNYYGAAPVRSYGIGCSNGGRHGMVAASRFGDQYDGILVGAPGLNLPKAAIQHALDVQTLHALNGDLRTSFSPADLAAVGAAINQSCDALDGLEDGMVSDIAACQDNFDIQSAVCQDNDNDQCISAAQAQALKTIFAGPRNSWGRQLYSEWAWDPGISGNNWQFWKVQSPIPPWDNLPLIAVMGAGSLAQIFTTPPTKVDGDPESLLNFLLNYDFDRDGWKIYAHNRTYRKSAMSFMAPPDVRHPKLRKLKRSGGKIILFHGVSDPVFSYLDTENWYRRLDRRYHGHADSFAKLYPVPGMNHCAGGPTTDDFNLFEQLVNWVENDQEPQAVTASVRADNPEIPANWSSTRTRKLCPYPETATYIGGNPESADSFVCQ
ncbi:tannase/feruloyl esterase family alpha/beta hydrolase [Gynuella sp.]|uniref:tannase/feruloyl esterase family alpha/beta hydrolase n=1 Tax=Gynuella sp. TaxID=2969146 RepID=UPI003D0B85D2